MIEANIQIMIEAFETLDKCRLKTIQNMDDKQKFLFLFMSEIVLYLGNDSSTMRHGNLRTSL